MEIINNNSQAMTFFVTPLKKFLDFEKNIKFQSMFFQRFQSNTFFLFIVKNAQLK